MGDVVVILEDNADRLTAMRACLGQVLPGTQMVVFEHAQQMIDWLAQHLAEAVLISLDHDLPLRNAGGGAIDCGTGRQVADYLASLPPTCRVIVHSANDACAAGMFFVLKDAGWPCSRVYACDDVAWVAAAWAEEVRRYVREGWVNVARSSSKRMEPSS